MTAITAAANNAVRDFATAGLPASGDHEPVKSDVRALFSLIDTALSSLGITGAITVKKSTRANLYAELTHAEGTLAIVYDDPTDSLNGIYVKAGASGEGNWEQTSIALPSTFAAEIAAVLAQIEDIDATIAAGVASAVGSAEASATAAADARDDALAYRDQAALAAATAPGVYASTAAGLAAVAEGETFWVEDDSTLNLYRDLSGVATLVATVASSAVFIPDQTTFTGSIAVGGALAGVTHASGSQGMYNTYLGLSAGLGIGLTNQWGNVGVGYGACNYFEESSDAEAGAAMFGNTFVGYLSGAVLHAAYDNTGTGALCLQNFRAGNDNCAYGIKSMQDFREGDDNCAFGYGTLWWLNSDTAGATSNANVAMGPRAGAYLGNGTTKLTQANDCVFLGSHTRALADLTSNEIVIGAYATGAGENTTTLGNDDTTATIIRGATTITAGLRLTASTFRQIVLEREGIGSWTIGNPVADSTSNDFAFVLNGAAKVIFDTGGNIRPATDAANDLGTSSFAFATGYINTVVTDAIEIGGINVLTGQAAAVSDPSGGSTVDAEARAVIGTVIDRLQGIGLFAAAA